MYKNYLLTNKLRTVFPHIVSAETILFLDLEIKGSQYIRPKVTVHKGAETIQGRKLFKGGNYRRKYGMYKFIVVYRCPLLATAAQLSWGRYVIPFETLSYS